MDHSPLNLTPPQRLHHVPHRGRGSKDALSAMSGAALTYGGGAGGGAAGGGGAGGGLPRNALAAAGGGGSNRGRTSVGNHHHHRHPQASYRSQSSSGSGGDREDAGAAGGEAFSPSGTEDGLNSGALFGGMIDKVRQACDSRSHMLCGRADEGLHCIPMTLPMWLPLSSA